MLRPVTILTIAPTVGISLPGQVQNPTQKATDPTERTPIFRVEVIARTSQAVNYLHRGGATKIDFQGTPLMAMAKGSAKVESERGVIHVSAEFNELGQPSGFGSEYSTVPWAISPDGRPVNLGELTLDHYGAGSTSKIETTSDIQTFGMIVTAEPYYAVTQPSDVVVMENIVRPDTRGVIESIDARYELLPRGTYTMQGRARGFVPIQVGKKNPFELYEAENAVQLARIAGADHYAAESFEKANAALQQAERYQGQKPGQKPVMTMARRPPDGPRSPPWLPSAVSWRNIRKPNAKPRQRGKKPRDNARKPQGQELTRRPGTVLEAEADRLASEHSKAEALAAAQSGPARKAGSRSRAPSRGA